MNKRTNPHARTVREQAIKMLTLRQAGVSNTKAGFAIGDKDKSGKPAYYRECAILAVFGFPVEMATQDRNHLMRKIGKNLLRRRFINRQRVPPADSR